VLLVAVYQSSIYTAPEPLTVRVIGVNTDIFRHNIPFRLVTPAAQGSPGKQSLLGLQIGQADLSVSDHLHLCIAATYGNQKQPKF